jgi:UDP-glucose 4-epimerase
MLERDGATIAIAVGPGGLRLHARMRVVVAIGEPALVSSQGKERSARGMTIRDSHVLVTGGAGFIGSHLVAALAPANRVTVVDDLSTGKLANLDAVRCDLVRADVAGPELARSFAGVEVVFHLAAQVSVELSVQDPVADARANVLGTVNVLECARRAGVRRVVLSSSSAVYGAAERVPTPETAPCLPDSPYAASKLACEQFLFMYVRLYGLSAMALRYMNVYGLRQDPTSPYSGVISIFADRARKGLPLVIYGDGEQTRDFVSVADVVRANIMAAESDASGEVANVGTGVQMSINRLAALCARGRVPIEYQPARQGDVKISACDPSRARTLLGFTAGVQPDEGIARYLDEIAADAA